MSKFSEKGYFVKENAPIYFTRDLDRTAKWFEEVLGWYSSIVERNEDGKGMYGAVFEMVPEVELTHLAPFTGFHLFFGEPVENALSFMQVQGVEKLWEYVRSKGWKRISDIERQPWGGKTCTLTTIDGCRIRIFE